MQKKVYLITGASSGIGREVARRVAGPETVLVLAARSSDKLTALANELFIQYHAECLVLPTDMTKAQDIEKLVEVTVQKYGRIDYLLSGAGKGDFKLAVDHTYDDYMDYFKVNTLGMMYLSNLAAQIMVEQGSGHISFIASVAGLIATPTSSVYSATKFAIIGYANALRLELYSTGISVTTVNPGPVKTAFFAQSQANLEYYEQIKWIALDAEAVADAIVKNMHRAHPKRELVLPYYFKLLANFYTLFPNVGDTLTRKLLNFKEG